MKTMLISMLVALSCSALALADDGLSIGGDVPLSASLNAGTGLGMETDSGAFALLELGGRLGWATKTVKLVGGETRTDRITNLALLAGELRLDLSDNSVRTIDVVLFDDSMDQRDDTNHMGVKAAELRLDKGATVEMELRIFDVEFGWDVLGKSVDGRALRAGFGAGYYLFWGDDDKGEGWFHGTILRGNLSGIYTFSPGLVARGSIDFFPLMQGGESIIYTGSIVQAQGSLERRLSKHLNAYVRARYTGSWQLNADETAFDRPKQDLSLTGGVVSRW